MANVSHVVQMVTALEASELFGPDFVDHCRVPVFIDQEQRIHWRYSARHIHQAQRNELTLAQLRGSTSLCGICWQSSRLKSVIDSRWSRGVPPDRAIDLLGDAVALVGLYQQADDIGKALEESESDAALLDKVASLQRGTTRVRHRIGDPLLDAPVVRLLERAVELEAKAADACSAAAIEHWALERTGDPTGLDVDRSPTVLAFSGAPMAGNTAMYATAIHHYRVDHSRASARVLVAPRFVVDALILTMPQYVPRLVTLPCIDSIEVVRTAAGLWDPSETGPLASISEALDMARRILVPAPTTGNTHDDAPST